MGRPWTHLPMDTLNPHLPMEQFLQRKWETDRTASMWQMIEKLYRRWQDGQTHCNNWEPHLQPCKLQYWETIGRLICPRVQERVAFKRTSRSTKHSWGDLLELSLGWWGWQPPALFIFPHHLDSVDKPWVWPPQLACCLSKHEPLTSFSHSLTEQLEHKGTSPRNVLNHKAAVCNTFQSQRAWGVPLFMFPSTLLRQIEAGSGHPGWPVASANLGPWLTSPSIPPEWGPMRYTLGHPWAAPTTTPAILPRTHKGAKHPRTLQAHTDPAPAPH